MKVVVCAVGRIREGISGGYIYSHDVWRAVARWFGGDDSGGIQAPQASPVLWELGLWHRLFRRENDSHRHGQGAAVHNGGVDMRVRGDDCVGSREGLLTPRLLAREYADLPTGSVLVFDGFALLQASEICFAEGHYREDIKHVAFVQYPFSTEPDASEEDRRMCAQQECSVLQKLDMLVGASKCSIQMFQDEYPQFFFPDQDAQDCEPKDRHRPALRIITPVARFKKCGLAKHRQSGAVATAVDFDRDVDQDDAASPGVVKFLTVSNFVPRKNIMMLLRALSKCQGPEFQPWRMSILANDQPSAYRTSIENFVKLHGMPVRFLKEMKETKEIAKVYLESHVFLHGSNWENYCMSASEAVCCGLVVISTRVGEICNFSHSKSAFFYDVGDEKKLSCILREILLVGKTRDLMASCSAAEDYARKIGEGFYDDTFLSFESFSLKWKEAIHDLSNTNSAKQGGSPDPKSIRNSHVLYMLLGRVLMYTSVPQFVHGGLGYLMTTIEVGNAINKILFWKSAAHMTASASTSTRWRASQPRSAIFFMSLVVCGAAATLAIYHSLHSPSANAWSIQIPLEIGEVDGVLIASVVQHARTTRSSNFVSNSKKMKVRKKVKKSKRLRLGIDTGSSLSWGCDAKCRVIVEQRHPFVRRRKLVVLNMSTRHKTLFFPSDETIADTDTEDFNVRFADGTKIQGIFRNVTLSFYGNESSEIETPPRIRMRLKFPLKIGAALRIKEKKKYPERGSEDHVPKFESGSVDGFLGLGIASNPEYPLGHSAWDQLYRALNITHDFKPSILCVGIDVRRPPFTMTLMRRALQSPHSLNMYFFA
eukprot:g4578.t1